MGVKLFPAYAGVILLNRQKLRKFSAFPRIRGGDPVRDQTSKALEDFSPHTRG